MLNITPESLLTSHQVGRLLQVSRRSINNWIEQGRIPAFRTPGGHRRVRAADLIEFLARNQMPVPDDLAELSKRRVMVVDDDQRQLRAVARFLGRHRDRIEVVCIERGIDALIEIGTFRPNVVALDIFLPDLDGLEVCRRINACDKTKNIDVIICSAQLTPQLNAAALAAGARCCLPKPLDAQRFLTELGVADEF